MPNSRFLTITSFFIVKNFFLSLVETNYTWTNALNHLANYEIQTYIHIDFGF